MIDSKKHSGSKYSEHKDSIEKILITGPEPFPIERGSWTLCVWGYTRTNEMIFYEMLRYGSTYEREQIDDYIESLAWILGLSWNGKEYIKKRNKK